MGLLGSLFVFICQFFPPKSKFAVGDIPDLSGKVIIVTGANTGVGFETAKALLAHNARVYVAARNQEKAEAAIEQLKTVTGVQALFLKLDLANLKSVKAAAEEFLSKEKELHVLFNNGAVMAPPVDQLTADGYDLQFGTNVLGHFYFTKLLIPSLLAAAKSSPELSARVVNTSSAGHLFSNLDFNTFKDGPARKKMGTQLLYCQSKFGNVVFATELARRYGDQGIISTSLHPGSIQSDLQRYGSRMQRYLSTILLKESSYGALTQLWAGTSSEGRNLNGKYLIPWARVGSAREDTQDLATGKELWAWLEEQVKDV
jgi:NAD(P)-dependent dehydrogenase (short-subunit alcohol dehydrogenase family)